MGAFRHRWASFGLALFLILQSGCKGAAPKPEASSPQEQTPFNPEDWPSLEEPDCTGIRAEVLRREGIKSVGPDPCDYKKGKWVDLFSENRSVIYEFEEAQVVPVIPLPLVHAAGGWRWSADQRAAFMSEMGDRHHFVVVSKSLALARAAESIEAFLPKNHQYRCEYLGAWILIKEKWGLSWTSAESGKRDELSLWCIKNYRREHYEHWIDEDDDCLSTREEVLIRDANPGSIVMKDPCKVESGVWRDPYTGRDFYTAAELDIDHVVPLGNAHANGGWAWPAWKKREYANDLAQTHHLLSVSATANRRKGMKGPEQYMPENREYACDYLKIWQEIKTRWGLAQTPKEKEFIKNSNCP